MARRHRMGMTPMQIAFERTPRGKRLTKRLLSGGIVDTSAKQARYNAARTAYHRALDAFTKKVRRKVTHKRGR